MSGTPYFSNWVKPTDSYNLTFIAIAPPCKDCHYHDGHASNANRCRNQLVVAPVGAPGPRREKMGSGAASGRLVHCARHRGSRNPLRGLFQIAFRKDFIFRLPLFPSQKVVQPSVSQKPVVGKWEVRKQSSSGFGCW